MPYGTLLTDTIQSSTAGTPPQFNDGNSVQIGTLCRAWVSFNGTTSPGTIRGNFNVGSVTKNATGDYTVNFTTSMPDGNYAVVGTTDFTTSFVVTINSTSAVPASGSIRINNRSSAGGAVDSSYIFVSVFR